MQTALYPVKVDGHWGYIDVQGSVCIEPAFEYCSDFSEGFASVYTPRGAGIIDASGNLIADLGHRSIYHFKEGRARFRSAANDLGGFIDTTGRTIVEPRYSISQVDYSEGTVLVSDEVHDFILDLYGNVVHQCRHGEMHSVFSHGLAAKSDAEGLIGYIDKQFQFRLRPQYTEASTFTEGLASVRLSTDLGAYIDTFGTVAFKGEFSCGKQFSEGVASAWVGGGEAFFDRLGNRLFGHTFLSAGYFDGGMATVELEPERIGYINREGVVVIPPNFQVAYPFRGGIAKVQFPGETSPFPGDLGYVRKDGTLIWRGQG